MPRPKEIVELWREELKRDLTQDQRIEILKHITDFMTVVIRKKGKKKPPDPNNRKHKPGRKYKIRKPPEENYLTDTDVQEIRARVEHNNPVPVKKVDISDLLVNLKPKEEENNADSI